MNRIDTPAFRLAFCALMAALGTVFMLSSSLIPILTYAAPMMASITLIPVLSEYGKKYAWMVWFVTAALALLLCADREAAFFYLLFGYYPILKRRLDRIRPRLLSVAAKLVFFTAVFAMLLFVLAFILGLEDIRGELWLTAAVYAALTVMLVFFDRVYDRLTLVYAKSLRKKLFRKTGE